MVWSVMLIVIAVLFAVGFLWPALWFVAIGVFIVWLASMVIWGANRRGGSTTIDSERPRHRVE
jgi:hypothetical protein